uniref:Uncharacterized protein n=1 Tax=Romanomermis culicivorax TaxID=13658 RepID=A0A915L213_ROMCU
MDKNGKIENFSVEIGHFEMKNGQERHFPQNSIPDFSAGKTGVGTFRTTKFSGVFDLRTSFRVGKIGTGFIGLKADLLLLSFNVAVVVVVELLAVCRRRKRLFDDGGCASASDSSLL